MFGQAMNPIIRSDGSPKFAMVATLGGALTNIILDPIFIFVFKWGMMGAINNMIHKYGAMDVIFSQEQYAQIPMAVVGIVMKFFQIVISIAVGMAAGCIPIAGYNVGAGRNDRALDLFKLLLFCEAAVGFVATIIVEFFPQQLIAIFGAANESVYYTEFAIKSFRIYLCMMTLATFNKATFIYLQSLGKTFLSTMLSMIREVIFGVGFALLLPVFFGLDGVLYSMPVSDVLTFIISLAVIRYTFKTLRVEEKAEAQKKLSPKIS